LITFLPYGIAASSNRNVPFLLPRIFMSGLLLRFVTLLFTG
jgi:hypothetical protein